VGRMRHARVSVAGHVTQKSDSLRSASSSADVSFGERSCSAEKAIAESATQQLPKLIKSDHGVDSPV